MKDITKKVLIGGGVLIASTMAASAVSYTIAKKLVGMALDRNHEIENSKTRVSGVK